MATGQLDGFLRHFRTATLLHEASGVTDAQLLESFISRKDPAAFAALVRRHGPMVWGVCCRVLRHVHDAEDAFQATFLVLVRKAAAVVPRAMVGNWLYGVAYRTAMKARAASNRRRALERQVEVLPESKVPQRDPWRDLQPLLDQELDRLPDKFRVAIVLCDLEGKTHKEAARQLGWPVGTLSTRLVRGRTMLAKRLTRHGLAVSGGALATILSQNASACVPGSVLFSTIKAAGLVAAGRAAESISAQVAALAQGVVKSMFLTKLKTMMVLVGTLGIIAMGMGVPAYHGFAQRSGNEIKKDPIKLAAQEPAGRPAANPADRKSEAHYCWLVFGPKGKVRALVRLDGEEVAVDRDGDGKFDSKGERVQSEKDCKDIPIPDPDGKTSYVITSVQALPVVPPEKFLAVRVHIQGPVDYCQECIVGMAGDRKAAPQARFNGPLTIGPERPNIENRAVHLVKTDLVNLGGALPEFLKTLAGTRLFNESTLPKYLPRTGEPANLAALIFTEGEGSFVAVVSPDDKDGEAGQASPLPRGVRPFLDVEFPASNQGNPPIKKRYPLDHLRGGILRGSVPVPDEAGAGKARVTFSLDGWKGMKVTPTTVEIPIDEPKEEKDQEQTAKQSKDQAPTEILGFKIKAEQDAVTLASVPPVVVKTVPEAGAGEVDPKLSEIKVTFSKEMQDGTWSWSTVSEESFPKVVGKPKYLADKRTCVLPVKLEPGKTYAIWVNSEKFGSFKDSTGRSAVPYLLVFETK